MKKRFTRYLITICVAVVLAGIVFAYELQYYDIKTQFWLVISNSAFVSGIVILMVGLLCFVSNKGGMDALMYVIYRVKNKFKNIVSDNYKDFTHNRMEKNDVPIDNMLTVAGVMIAVAVITAVIN